MRCKAKSLICFWLHYVVFLSNAWKNLLFFFLLLLRVHTFFAMEGGDSEFANFTLPTLKMFLEARSQNVSVNKQ